MSCILPDHHADFSRDGAGESSMPNQSSRYFYQHEYNVIIIDALSLQCSADVQCMEVRSISSVATVVSMPCGGDSCIVEETGCSVYTPHVAEDKNSSVDRMSCCTALKH